MATKTSPKATKKTATKKTTKAATKKSTAKKVAQAAAKQADSLRDAFGLAPAIAKKRATRKVAEAAPTQPDATEKAAKVVTAKSWRVFPISDTLRGRSFTTVSDAQHPRHTHSRWQEAAATVRP